MNTYKQSHLQPAFSEILIPPNKCSRFPFRLKAKSNECRSADGSAAAKFIDRTRGLPGGHLESGPPLKGTERHHLKKRTRSGCRTYFHCFMYPVFEALRAAAPTFTIWSLTSRSGGPREREDLRCCEGIRYAINRPLYVRDYARGIFN